MLREVFESGRPLTYVRSAEEQRVGTILREVALRFPTPLPVWTWSLTQGINLDGEPAAAGTQAPRAALDFIAANPGFPTNTSIRVRGTFNGTAFTYTSALDAKQEYTFTPPLHINGSGSETNLTIRLDISTWFKTGAGAIVNPNTANAGGANESLVQNNIKASIKAFEDKDKNGDERDG